VCFLITIAVSFATRPREDKELVGLVYSLTERPSEENVVWYLHPVTLAVAALSATAALNIIFK